MKMKSKTIKDFVDTINNDFSEALYNKKNALIDFINLGVGYYKPPIIEFKNTETVDPYVISQVEIKIYVGDLGLHENYTLIAKKEF